MASNKTMLKSVERKKKRLDRMVSSLPFTRPLEARDKKQEDISKLRHEIILLEQQIQFNKICGIK